MGIFIRSRNRRSPEFGGALGKVLALVAVVSIGALVICGVVVLGGALGLGGANPANVNGTQATGLSTSQGKAAGNPDNPSSGPFSPSSDMRGYKDDLDVDALNAKLSAKGSALAGHAQEIDDVAKAYNLDPAIYASLIMEESGWGTNRATKDFNDCTSVMTGANASQFRQFDSQRDAMNYTANSLCNGSYYFTKGNTTLGSVGAIYAPPGASNDPNGTNSGWAADIVTIANTQIPKKTPVPGGTPNGG